MTRLLFTLLLPLLVAPAALAGSMTEAMNAYRAGDYAEAVRQLEPWAEKGVVQAQYTLGSLYTVGEGVSLDMEQGIRWLRAAAEQGHRLAAESLGKIYVSGLGVPRDEAEAIKWFNLAAELADGSADDCD